MGIFDRLKNAILGTHLQPGPAPTGQTAAGQTQAAAQSATPSSQPGKPTAQPSSSPTAAGASAGPHVDVEAVLNQKAAARGEKLNWQSSIVDLMKLVDLDPSLENRKTLAHELGYSGNPQDSASMNVWLHREVMRQLAASGGKVPDTLRH